MPRVKVELLNVTCRDPEDFTMIKEGDEFYLTGMAAGGSTAKPVLTSVQSIDNGQTRSFRPEQAVIFDADVPPGAPVRLALNAYDEDAQKAWQRYSAWIDELQRRIQEWLEHRRPDGSTPFPEVWRQPRPGQEIPAPTTGPLDPTGKQAAKLLGYFVDAAQFIGELDKDDLLGSLAIDIPTGDLGPSGPEREWHARGRRAGEISDWDYTIRYRVTLNEPAVHVGTIDPSRPYLIIPGHVNKAIDVHAYGGGNGDRVQLWDRIGGDNQRWFFRPLAEGYYAIAAKHSGRCLDVDVAQPQGWANGGRVQQWEFLGGHNQQWRLHPLTDGQFAVIARHSTRALDVREFKTHNGANIQQWDYVAGPNQRWRLVE